jgi:uncharacterized protein YbaP (TraB family)
VLQIKSFYSAKVMAFIVLVAAILLGQSSLNDLKATSGIEAFEHGDYAKALEIWLGQAEKGDKEAQFYLGYLYDSGQGVKENNATAASWYSKAAVKGQSSAQFNLAAMFVNGDGVVRDQVLAYMLFDLAADLDPDGARERNELIPYMTPLQIARANRLARLARRGDMAALLTQMESAAFTDTETPTSANWDIWTERDLIAMAQRALGELGYDAGPSDGLMGKKTRAAIRAFQEESGVERDGQVSKSLLAALYTAFDERLGDVEIPYGQGRFWKIEGNDAAPSYLLGTFHSNDPRILQLPPKILTLFRKAATVALELRIYSLDSYEALSPSSYQNLIIDDGRSLRDIVGRDLYSDIVAALTPLGFPEAVISQIKPWGIYHYLTVTMDGYQPSEREGTFLDLWLGQKAIYYRKKLVGLETVDEQISVFSGLTERDQVELLDSVIALSSEGALSLEELKILYLDGDLATILSRMMQPAMRLGPKAMLKVVTRLLDNRNEVMVERMQELLIKGNAFIAVGAAHLPGEAGILKLLADQGYTLTRAY